MVFTFNKNKILKHQRFNKNYYLIELKHTHTHTHTYTSNGHQVHVYTMKSHNC
jgi:hypothetical protein